MTCSVRNFNDLINIMDTVVIDDIILSLYKCCLSAMFWMIPQQNLRDIICFRITLHPFFMRFLCFTSFFFIVSTSKSPSLGFVKYKFHSFLYFFSFIIYTTIVLFFLQSYAYYASLPPYLYPLILFFVDPVISYSFHSLYDKLPVFFPLRSSLI